MGRVPFLWTNDDIQAGLRETMERQINFLRRWDLKGSFFVVPCHEGRPITADRELVRTLQAAARDGHEINQHSTTHACEENGIADLRMYDLMGEEAKLYLARQRFAYETVWSVEALVAQIGWGRQVWTNAFGKPSPGFRPGCGSFCGNMYHALAALGFEWCSAQMSSPTSWMWNHGRFGYPYKIEPPVRPYRVESLIEYPFIGDVAFRVPQERIEDFVELGWRHFEDCLENQWPFVLVSHWHGLEHAGGTGYRVHEKLLDRIMASGRAHPMTLSEYHQRVLAREYPLAEPDEVPPMPGTLPDWHVWACKNHHQGSLRTS